jgi:hypothetical protein
VDDLHTFAHADHGGQVRIVAAGVDANLVAEVGERGRQLRDVPVLDAGVVLERARVLGDHRDAHWVLLRQLDSGRRPELRL